MRMRSSQKHKTNKLLIDYSMRLAKQSLDDQYVSAILKDVDSPLLQQKKTPSLRRQSSHATDSPLKSARRLSVCSSKFWSPTRQKETSPQKPKEKYSPVEQRLPDHLKNVALDGDLESAFQKFYSSFEANQAHRSELKLNRVTKTSPFGDLKAVQL